MYIKVKITNLQWFRVGQCHGGVVARGGEPNGFWRGLDLVFSLLWEERRKWKRVFWWVIIRSYTWHSLEDHLRVMF